MTPRLPTSRHDFAPTALKVGLGAAVVLALLALFAPSAAARGLLVAVLFWIAIPAGSLLLLLIHRLTGGAWGEAFRPVLGRAAGAMPVLALFFVPVLLALPRIYVWASDPGSIPHADVARYYLNPPAFILRSLPTLMLWSLFAFLAAARPARLSPVLAGLGLLVYGVTISLVSLDWFLSLDPRFRSTDFGMSTGTAHLLAALGWMAFVGAAGERARSDIAKLLLACALGLLYLDLMQFLVSYDGNLPDKAAWYLRRGGNWTWLIAGAFVGAVAVPLAASMTERWRRSPLVLRTVGAAVLLGLLARTIWLLAPEWDAGPALWGATAAALLTVGGVWIGLAEGALRTRLKRLAAGREPKPREAVRGS